MSSPHFIPARLALAVVLLALLLSAGSALQAQTEEGLLKKAEIKLKVKKYEQAAAILKQAREMYPTSVEVARLTAELYEKRGDDPDSLIEAYRELIRVLKLKKVTEGKLDPKESRLLKKTEKKLTVVAKVRGEVDAAVMELINEGIKTCRLLARLEKYTQACFVYQRLNGLVKDEQLKQEVQNLGRELKGNALLLKRPADGPGTGSEKAQKLVREARRLLKAGKLEEARLSCNAALEADPGLAEARAILYEVAQKDKDTARMLTQGLSYLLFRPREQSAKQAQGITKRISREAPELRAFFSATARAADKVCKTANNAVRSKSRHDVEYALLRLTCLTHATKKVESTISKISAFFGGVMPWHRIFDGKDLEGWKTGRFVTQQDGCIEIRAEQRGTFYANYNTVPTRGSFVFIFSFQVNEPMKSSDRRVYPVIMVKMWGDDKPFNESDTISLAMTSDARLQTARLERPSRTKKEFDTLAKSGFTGPVFTPGTWYKTRIDYEHKKAGDSKVVVAINGEKALTIPVAQNVAPARTGYVGMAQQSFRLVKFKDIYLVP